MANEMRVLDLFSGIGGFSLGLERAGMRTVAFCEIDPFCRQVLKKNWPDVEIFEDVKTLTAQELANRNATVDIICGGFPCQDISNAGHQAGLAGERSGLWAEYARLIGELRPSYVIVENVAALLHRGMGDVLGDLATLGYDAEWECIPACAVGAPHIRDRVWILAYPRRELGQLRGYLTVGGIARDGCSSPFPETDRWRTPLRGKDWELSEVVPGVHPGVAATWWRHQSSVARTADGLHGQLDRNKSCGNAVIPHIPEIIGRAILAAKTSRA